MASIASCIKNCIHVSFFSTGKRNQLTDNSYENIVGVAENGASIFQKDIVRVPLTINVHGKCTATDNVQCQSLEESVIIFNRTVRLLLMYLNIYSIL